MNRRSKGRGFSLIELMVAVAIVAILAAIAIPAYRRYVLQGNRTDAIRALAYYQQALERCYSQSFSYTGCAQAPAANTLTPNDDYEVNVTLNPSSYTLVATAQNSQTADTECSTFQISQNGAQSAQDNLDNDTTTTCWGGH